MIYRNWLAVTYSMRLPKIFMLLRSLIYSVSLLLSSPGTGTLSPTLVCLFKLFQVLVKSISQQDLTSTTLTPLHLHDHLASGHLDLLLLHTLTAFFHASNLFAVTSLLSLPLLPLLVCDSSHDLHALLGLLLFIINASLLVIFNLLLVGFTLLFHQTLLQPVFECFVALLLLDLFM